MVHTAHTETCLFNTAQLADKQDVNYFIFNLNMLSLSLTLRNFRIKSTAMSSRVKRSILLRNGADFLFPFISSGFSFILSFRLELKIYQVDRLTGRTFNVLHASI